MKREMTILQMLQKLPRAIHKVFNPDKVNSAVHTVIPDIIYISTLFQNTKVEKNGAVHSR